MANRKSYRIEYTFKAKADLLYNYLSTPYNLATWFADDVDINQNTLIFSWEGSSERAHIVKQVHKKKIQFKWVDRPGEEYLTFEIETDDVTGGTVLFISDFDDEDQLDEARLMWDSAVENLKRTIGG